MCICINCKWVDRCITYHDVENNHGVDNICDFPDFKAKQPFIHVSIIKDKMVFTKQIGMYNLVKVLQMNLVNGPNVNLEWNCLFKGNR